MILPAFDLGSRAFCTFSLQFINIQARMVSGYDGWLYSNWNVISRVRWLKKDFPLLFPLRYDVDSKSPDLSKHVSAQTVAMNRPSVKAVPRKNSELWVRTLLKKNWLDDKEISNALKPLISVVSWCHRLFLCFCCFNFYVVLPADWRLLDGLKQTPFFLLSPLLVINVSKCKP